MLQQTNSDLSAFNSKVLINEEAIFNSIKNLLLTRRGERFFAPQIGVELDELIFQLSSEISVEYVKALLVEKIKKYEPRVADLDIEIEIDNDNGVATLTFIIELDDLSKFTKSLRIVR